MKSTLRQFLVFLMIIALFGCGALTNESPMKVNPNAKQQLQQLAAQDNFAPTGLLYTGVHDPILREKLNAQFSLAVAHFIAAVDGKASNDQYLALLKTEINHFERAKLETDDAEQVGTNFEHIMDCIGLESSDGILNDWMYGSFLARLLS